LARLSSQTWRLAQAPKKKGCFMSKFVFFMAGLTLAGSLSAQVEPTAGRWKTWVIASGGTLRLAAPPDDATTASEVLEIKSAISQLDSNALQQIHFWDSGAPGYRWMQMTEQLAVSEGLPTPLQTRALALVGAAIYDATVAAWDSKYAYMRKHPSEIDPTIQTAVQFTQSPSYPSEHAVTAGVAAAVLTYLFPDQAEAINKAASEAAQSRILAGVAFPSDVAAGIQQGALVGKAFVAYAAADRSNLPFSGSFPPTPGVFSSKNPVTPLAGMCRPWVLTAGNQFRPAAPPAFGSAGADAQYAMVKNLARTNAINHSAWFWQPGFFQPWLQTVEQKIFENHLDADAPRAARVYALETIAQHDATLACWDSKYQYLELRPSLADPTIVPLFANPQHPGYPSGHACASGASAAVMSYLFPSDGTSFSAMSTDAGTSTFDAGIHTELDVSTGFTLGGQVGQQVVLHGQGDGSN
jgi:membrane-associated phospholipid phosphatase